jgi:hypothetical protein
MSVRLFTHLIVIADSQIGHVAGLFVSGATFLASDIELQAFCSRPQLYIYLPVASRVNSHPFNDLQSHRAFLLATPPVSRDYAYENK